MTTPEFDLPPGGGTSDPLDIHVNWERALRGLRPAEVLEVGVDLECLRRRLPLFWMQSISAGVAGGGFGALLSGGTEWAVVALVAGSAAWIMLLFASHERHVSVVALSGKFIRMVDQFPRMGEHEHDKNSGYIYATAQTQLPTLSTRIQSARTSARVLWKALFGKTKEPDATSE